MDGSADAISDCDPSQISLSLKLLKALKENRIEMMIVTVLLYSTGLLEQATSYAGGVC